MRQAKVYWRPPATPPASTGSRRRPPGDHRGADPSGPQADVERLPVRVQQHAPGLARLELRYRRAERHARLLGLVQVVDVQVEVVALLPVGVRPRRRLVALDLA